MILILCESAMSDISKVKMQIFATIFHQTQKSCDNISSRANRHVCNLGFSVVRQLNNYEQLM